MAPRNEKKIDRRSFLDGLLKGTLLTMGGWGLYPVIAYLIPPSGGEIVETSVKAGKLGDFPFNSSRILKMGRKAILLIRKRDGKFAAFSAQCTHLDCTVQFLPENSIIWCACHNGKYDLNGNVISGPPPKPLETLEVHIKGEDVIVRKS